MTTAATVTHSSRPKAKRAKSSVPADLSAKPARVAVPKATAVEAAQPHTSKPKKNPREKRTEKTATKTDPSHFQGRWLGSIGGLAVFAGLSFAAGAIGGRVTMKPKNKLWYRLLRKSDYTPPDRVFSIVWPVLYSLGAFSAWRVARTEPSAVRTRALALWGAQLATNAAWSPLFFGAHQTELAMADLGSNYVTLGAYANEARKVDTLAFVSVLPTMAWLTFAGTLNGAVVMKRQMPGL